MLSKYYQDIIEPLTLLTIDTELLTSPWQFDDETTPLAKIVSGEWELPTLPAST